MLSPGRVTLSGPRAQPLDCLAPCSQSSQEHSHAVRARLPDPNLISLNLFMCLPILCRLWIHLDRVGSGTTTTMSAAQVVTAPEPLRHAQNGANDHTYPYSDSEEPVSSSSASYRQKDSRTGENDEFIPGNQFTDCRRGHSRHKARGTLFSPTQVSVLVEAFKVCDYPSRTQLFNLAEYLRVDVLRVKSWYQNVRTRGLPGRVEVNEHRDPISEVLSGMAVAKRKNEVIAHGMVDATCQTPGLPDGLAELFAMGLFDALLPSSTLN
ncbi:homeobox-leucine zipper/HDG1-like protein [Carpediemonas membranifera]|uniref:Homeobox-leucine zipper/HDG1-like protein n=1 Tax=Carpediemonas membranifera TaxID=201153 RepID=A0A8J6E5R5_9EUKA|nr:homeobox-leucine zipper/HDG1-like protein [Carpediemonas membranifera]|eukprot:KAG9396187.1 homeobox-leucine zipper/HDG1-like protein [Carpediemonas membranifera]